MELNYFCSFWTSFVRGGGIFPETIIKEQWVECPEPSAWDENQQGDFSHHQPHNLLHTHIWWACLPRYHWFMCKQIHTNVAKALQYRHYLIIILRKASTVTKAQLSQIADALDTLFPPIHHFHASLSPSTNGWTADWRSTTVLFFCVALCSLCAWIV